jgi:hypothetical protein
MKAHVPYMTAHADDSFVVEWSSTSQRPWIWVRSRSIDEDCLGVFVTEDQLKQIASAIDSYFANQKKEVTS